MAEEFDGVGERAAYRAMPKAELHLHLEGAVPRSAFAELVRKYDGASPSPEALDGRFRYRDFPHFIETWCWMTGYLREYEDFAFIAEAVARDLARQNVRYAEAFYSPGGFVEDGLSVQRITEAIRSGLDRVPGTRVNLVIDLVRDLGPAFGATTLEAVNEVKASGVIGIGIGGSEQAYPPEPYAAVYERARQLGFRTTAHAGEAAGPESVRGALRALRVDRIGHGVRSVEDTRLVEELAASGVPLEVCPVSNLRTAVVPSIEAHPVRRLRDAGVKVTVSTDDPAMFNTGLDLEYALLEERLGFSRAEIADLVLESIRSSWLSAAEKVAMLESFTADPEWLRA